MRDIEVVHDPVNLVYNVLVVEAEQDLVDPILDPVLIDQNEEDHDQFDVMDQIVAELHDKNVSRQRRVQFE